MIDITYPDLPITERRDELLAAIRDHQVVVVAGDTGSGKSTQLPKMCLELGRGAGRANQGAMIGHTQPRRLAARTVAERIAEELEVPLGQDVGYAVRFNDKVGPTTRLKVMTDGILLAEIQRDRLLQRYDTLIIDEAHERSLNIDFLLGYLTTLLPKRPDLKLIVTSATIDTERFAEHFAKVATTTILQVSGRTYPVELRYRPFGADAVVAEGAKADDRDQIQAITDAVEELCAAGPGDILVFLSGEREIRDTEDALKDLAQQRNIDLIPLYARLGSTEQHRVFQAHTKRRVVLATNVAETSLTVPGIRYVIDAGTARISRYSRRLKVQRLPIEKISQASANQRSGRCGRVAPGIAIRLYSEEDFDARDEFTEPEILRTNLASVVLQMAAQRLGDIAAFPFVEPPDARSIRDGIDLLHELGAFDDEEHLTPIGRKLARVPLDPRLGRMVIEAHRLGCVRDVLVISAALSIQDPRERPTEGREAADALHRRFDDESSDFISLLNLWTYLREQQKERSNSQFRKMCKAEHLNHLRVREWQDIVSQLRQVLGELDIRLDTAGAHHDKVHQALLTGLLSQVGSRDEAERTQPSRNQRDPRDARRQRAEYVGVRNARFAIAPGSVLSKKGGRWVMVGELVETNRLWGRVAARIQPEWIEQLGAHLCTRSYGDPRWDAARSSAVVTERVMMRGLTIVAGRTVQLGRIDPTLARELFIRHALIDGEWKNTHAFVKANTKLLDELQAIQERSRRGDLLASSEDLFAFFDQHVPATVTSGPQFDKWWRKTSAKTPDLLTFTRDLLLRKGADGVDLDAFPDRWHTADLHLRVSYTFDPLEPDDGVTIHVPLEVLNRLRADEFEWQVPGLRRELITELIRTLPKALRRQLVPAGEYADAFFERAGERVTTEPLTTLAADVLGHLVGTPIAPTDFSLSELPRHLRPTFSVEDGGRPLATGKDLRVLQRDLRDRARLALAETFPAYERSDVRTWDLGELPKVVEAKRAGSVVRGYPSLVDEAGRVAVRVLTSAEAQERAMWEGTTRLLLLGFDDVVRGVRRAIAARPKIALALSRHGDANGMIDDCIEAAVEHLVIVKGGPAWDAIGFDALRKAVAADLSNTAVRAATSAAAVIELHDRVYERMSTLTAAVYDDAVVDMQQQIERLVPHGFVRVLGVVRLGHVERFLTAMERRIDKLVGAADKDREKMRRISVLQRECDAAPPVVRARVGWLLEELRVSVFAQQLGTAEPVSEERIRRELRTR